MKRFGNAKVAIISIAMTAVLLVSGLEKYRGLVVGVFSLAGFCVGGLMLAAGLKHRDRIIYLVVSALWICWVLTSIFVFWSDREHERLLIEGVAIVSWVVIPTFTIIPAAIWVLSHAAANVARRDKSA